MKKDNQNCIFKRIVKEIKMIREKGVNDKPTRNQEEYVEVLYEETGIEIEADTFRKYEAGKRCCSIKTFLQLAMVGDKDLNELKREISQETDYQKEKDNWGNYPADVFINIAIEFDIDLNKIKNYF